MPEAWAPLEARVLVVSDISLDRYLLGQLVRFVGSQVLVAAAGPRALTRMAEERVDMVLLDAQLPELASLTVLTRMKGDPELRNIPVVMISEADDLETVVRCLAHGAEDYVTRPFEPTLLAARVRACLERKLGRDREALQHRELERINAQLREVNDQKNMFLGMAAHDLRNPLAVITGYTRFMLKHPEGQCDRSNRYLDNIQSSARFMLTLVEDLLDVSTLEAGQLHLELEPRDLRELTARALEMLQPLANDKAISLQLEAPPDPVEALVDGLKVDQVLTNLLTNAIKYSHPQSTVEVCLEPGEEVVRVKVRDQGQGIPAEELSRLFQPFGRTSVKSTRGESSTGLGLAIARRVVEGHGGEIGVDSRVGHGSTFWFTLLRAPGG